MHDLTGSHEPVSREVLRQVRRIELRTRGAVDSRFSGEYQSVFKGQGLEFCPATTSGPSTGTCPRARACRT
jgi:hypothetical protein